MFCGFNALCSVDVFGAVLAIICILIILAVSILSAVFIAFKYDQKEAQKKHGQKAKNKTINYIGCNTGIYKTAAEQKGAMGENAVANVIRRMPQHQFLLNDFILSVNGKTTQVDHIVVNSNGVFVIETKNYSGKIYGSENSEIWYSYYKTSRFKRIINGGNERREFYNPVKQNDGHVKAVKKIIGFVPIYSIVVFVNADISKVFVPGVIPLSMLQGELSRPRGTYITKEQAQTYVDKLCGNKTRANISLTEHVNAIYDRRAGREEKIANKICPACGGKLVERSGRYGKFLGCSNYPNCNFIHNIK